MERKKGKKGKRGEEKPKKSPRPTHDPNKNHQAYAARDRHPDRILRRIIQSSGYAEAEKYAGKFGLKSTLQAIQTQKVLGADGKVQTMPVRWIERKKAEAERRQ